MALFLIIAQIFHKCPHSFLIHFRQAGCSLRGIWSNSPSAIISNNWNEKGFVQNTFWCSWCNLKKLSSYSRTVLLLLPDLFWIAQACHRGWGHCLHILHSEKQVQMDLYKYYRFQTEDLQEDEARTIYLSFICAGGPHDLLLVCFSLASVWCDKYIRYWTKCKI